MECLKLAGSGGKDRSEGFLQFGLGIAQEVLLDLLDCSDLHLTHAFARHALHLTDLFEAELVPRLANGLEDDERAVAIDGRVEGPGTTLIRAGIFGEHAETIGASLGELFIRRSFDFLDFPRSRQWLESHVITPGGCGSVDLPNSIIGSESIKSETNCDKCEEMIVIVRSYRRASKKGPTRWAPLDASS